MGKKNKGKNKAKSKAKAKAKAKGKGKKGKKSPSPTPTTTESESESRSPEPRDKKSKGSKKKDKKDEKVAETETVQPENDEKNGSKKAGAGDVGEESRGRKPSPRKGQISLTESRDPFAGEKLDEEMKIRRGGGGGYEFGFGNDDNNEFSMKNLLKASQLKPKVQPWLQGRLALSQQASRFELPMDMKLLETMTPVEYLRQYVIVSTRRHSLYHRIFVKHKDRQGFMYFKDLERAMKDVLINTLSSQQFKDLCDMIELDEEEKIEYKLFSGMAALAERMLYPKFVTEDTMDMPEFQKEKIECADFCALEWKFHGINVNPPVRKLLQSL